MYKITLHIINKIRINPFFNFESELCVLRAVILKNSQGTGKVGILTTLGAEELGWGIE
jgi:hypothetical protein